MSRDVTIFLNLDQTFYKHCRKLFFGVSEATQEETQAATTAVPDTVRKCWW